MKSKTHFRDAAGQHNNSLSSSTYCAETLVPTEDKREQITKYGGWLAKLFFLIIVLLPTMCFFIKTPVSALPSKNTVTDSPTETELSARFADSNDLKSSALLILSDPDYGSTQGMCVAENRYIIVGRYRKDGAKDLMVYDVIEKKIKASNVFFKSDPDAADSGTNVDLGHMNGLAYYDGYIYVPRIGDDRGIIRLKFNEDCSIVFDSAVYTAGMGKPTPSNISCYAGSLYWTAYGSKNGQFDVYRSVNGNENIELAFSSDFGGLVTTNLLSKQGMAFDGNYLYFAFSGRLNVPSAGYGTDWQKLVRNTEKIIITTCSGRIVKTLTFPRGSYGEIEDVDTIKLGNSTYLIISCNQNDDGVACVYAVPLFQDTTPSGYLEVSNMDRSFYQDRQEFIVYCDNAVCIEDGSYNPMKSNPFASGLTQDRFTSVYAALNYIKRLGCPVKLYITGEYGDLVFKNLPAGISFVFDDASVKSLSFTQCPGITLEGKNKAVLGSLKAEKSVILVASGVSLIKNYTGPENAVDAQYSILTGSFSEISGFKNKIQNVQGIVDISCTNENKNARLEVAPSSKQKTEQAEENKTSTVELSYNNQDVVSKISQNGKTVMLNLTFQNINLGETNSVKFSGMLPKEYCPAADSVFPAVIAGDIDGADPKGMCCLHISNDGILTVYAARGTIEPSDFLLVTGTYLTE